MTIVHYDVIAKEIIPEKPKTNRVKIRKSSKFTKDDCFKELQRLTEALGKKVSRDHWRTKSNISESVIMEIFGTWAEFMSEIGLAPTRAEKKILNRIALHSSKEDLRALTVEKSTWAGNYDRPCNKRFQTVLAGSDMHDLNCDPFYRRLFIETAKRIQPSKIVLNGDVFDLPEFAKYTLDEKDMQMRARLLWVKTFLGDLREACPDTEINFIEGNHEYRAFRVIKESNAFLSIMISENLGATMPDLLGLTKFQVNYYAKAELGAFTEKDIEKELNKNYLIINKQLMFHHFPQGRNWSIPGAHGHHHKHLVWNDFSAIHGSYEWHQMGCGHKRDASYTDGQMWSNGFLLAHMDTSTQRTQFEYIDTTGSHCFIGGTFYERTNEEMKSFF